MPSPAQVWERLVKTFTKPIAKTTLIGHAWASLRRVLLALLVSWAFGIAFGILIGWNKKARAFFGSIFEVIRPIPPIAWIPIVIMWFGIGEFPKILLVFIGTFVPLVINTSTGIEMVDKINIQVGQIFGGKNRQIQRDRNSYSSSFYFCRNPYFCKFRMDNCTGGRDAWRKCRTWISGNKRMAGKRSVSGNGFCNYHCHHRSIVIYDPAETGEGGVPMEQLNKRMEVRNLSKTFFGKKGYFTAIEDVSLDVYDGEFLVILGPGRCGKTVLLNIMSGLEEQTEGQIIYNGKEWKGLNPEIGMVFQKLALMPFKTVIENVELALKFRGMEKEKRREIARHYIELVGLKGFEDYYPKQLSGGMQQRVGIARAYAADPKLLIMDEPFGKPGCPDKIPDAGGPSENLGKRKENYYLCYK